MVRCEQRSGFLALRGMRVLALGIGPLVWFAALLVRHLGVETAGFTVAERARFDAEPFAAPGQLAAYARQPELVTAGYALFALASILLCATVIVFAREIGGRLAFAGGAVLVASLFARLYFSGIDLTAFVLVDRMGLDRAAAFAMESYVDLSYGLWRVPVAASAGSIVGAVLLAIGGWRAGKLGVVPCFLLLSFGWVFMGVLKEATLITVLHGGVAAVVLFGWWTVGGRSLAWPARERR
ncbi:hypothetical protein C8D88_107213 [Lentzea atacamensis]|uniref:Uncharacterized protein n=2 Tax=Lentzea atacamensis TaxID=531938 RepID=A0A316HWC5_9PSEU|nr:hypothetical protein C8D88_107213 [Lentzea atacamensis]